MRKGCVWQNILSPIHSQFSKALILLVVSRLMISPAFAACHAVAPTGSGAMTGANWTNAYSGLPATLVRGDVYYLADGTYPGFNFKTPASGSATVEIRKAQVYDNCTSTGWNTSTMGSSQAIFQYTSSEPVIAVGASYLTINGNGTYAFQGCGGGAGATRSSGPPTPSDCGIKVDNSTCTSSTSDACDNPIKVTAANVTNLTMDYVETLGTNNNTAERMVIFAPYSGDAYPTYKHLFLHNAGCVYIQDGQQNETVSYSYFWGNSTDPSGCHGQASFSDGAESDTTYANNVFRDISGTAIWTFAANSTTHDSWAFYNNVIWNDSQANGQQEDGIIACINAGTVCTNFMFVQNTMVNLNYATGTVFSNLGGSITFENNIWYLNEQISGSTLYPGGPQFTMNGSTLTEDYNSFLQTGSAKCGTGAHDVTDASAPNPFVNWTSGNFNLASEMPDWTNRMALSSPYTTDPKGTPRTTDRGAYQSFVPSPPSNLTAAQE